MKRIELKPADGFAFHSGTSGRTLLKSHVNHTLDTIEDYKGRVEDIDVNLWRGAYPIEDVRLDKITAHVKR